MSELIRKSASGDLIYKQSSTIERIVKDYSWLTESDLETFETVFVDKTGKIIQTKTGQCYVHKEKLKNGVSLETVKIPGGVFLMGSPEGEGSNAEKPQHLVTVPSFFMGKFPVTQAQWNAVADLPQVKHKIEPCSSSFNRNNLPVNCVSWYDAVEFCARLSRATGEEYRLPSEAEWEYAARAGTTTPFHFGETIISKLANYDGRETYADEPKGEYRTRIKVGSFSPNLFGLYDMHGNTGEWCEDDWHQNYQDAPKDGSAWLSGKSRVKVIRGGSWNDFPSNCRSAYRSTFHSDSNNSLIGFRVVRIMSFST